MGFISTILPADENAREAAELRWNCIAKPLGSLGALEDAITAIAALTGNAKIDIKRRAVLVMCADNGVVEEGVTQTGQEITALVAGNLLRGDTSVCKMAAVAGADVIPVDMGMITRVDGLVDCHVADGTQNFTRGPAMTREQAEQAVNAGIRLVKECKEKGYTLIATGEMGIGNTTTSSAIAAVLLSMPVRDVTGRGAGLSDEGLVRKISAIERGIALNEPDKNDPFDVLSKLGGFDIAGMTGVFLGGAIYRVPVIIDGFISAVSALVAARMAPLSKCAMLASHISAEPAAIAILKELGVKPLICAGMRLGEGTGAVCAMPLLDLALSVYEGMSTFDDIEMEAYTPLGGESK